MTKKYDITVEDAAEILDVSKKTVYRRLRSGKLPGKKKETKQGLLQWFISEQDLNVATMKNEIVDVAEIQEPVSVEEFKETLKSLVREVVQENNHQLLEENQKMIEKSQEILEENRKLQGKVDSLEKIIEQQNQVLNQIQEKQDQTLLSRLKKIFKGSGGNYEWP